MARLLEAAIAPDFQAVDSGGRPVALADFRGHALWLILRRYAACPFCAVRLRALAREYPAVKAAGVELVVVFPSSLDHIKEYALGYEPGFRILSDPELAIYDAYGSEVSWAGALRSAPGALSAVVKSRVLAGGLLDKDGKLHRMPCEFLIDPSGKLARVFYGDDFHGGIESAEVIAWGNGLKAPPGAFRRD